MSTVVDIIGWRQQQNNCRSRTLAYRFLIFNHTLILTGDDCKRKQNFATDTQSSQEQKPVGTLWWLIVFAGYMLITSYPQSWSFRELLVWKWWASQLMLLWTPSPHQCLSGCGQGILFPSSCGFVLVKSFQMSLHGYFCFLCSFFFLL